MKTKNILAIILIILSFTVPFAIVLYSELKALDFKEKEQTIKELEVEVSVLYTKKGRMYYALMLQESGNIATFDSLKLIVAMEN